MKLVHGIGGSGVGASRGGGSVGSGVGGSGGGNVGGGGGSRSVVGCDGTVPATGSLTPLL